MSSLSTLTPLAAGIVLRATLLFAATAVALLALRRASAATRHRVATVGLAAGLVLPLLSAVLPRVPVALPARLVPSAPVGSRTQLLLLGLWTLGTLAVAARLVVGWSRVRKLSREASVLWDAEWLAERDEAARRLEVRRTVSLKESADVPVAITSGWRRPFLLVGRAARFWAVERRRVVLLHELAHVKRADWPALLVAEASVALYWFHPIALWLGRQVRREAEQACDELVIAAGTKPSVYAGHLLGIFRSVGAPHPVAPALAIARPHNFEARLRAILDPRVAAGSRTTSGGRWAVAGLVAAGAAVVALDPQAASSLRPLPMGREIAAVTSQSSTHTSTCTHTRTKTETDHLVVARVAVRTQEASRDAEARDVEPNDSDDAATAEPGTPDLPEGESLPAIWRPGTPASEPRPATGFVVASNSHKSPRDGSDWYDQGMRLHRRGKYEEAIADFQKAIEDGYREDASSYNIACGYALLGNKDKAFEWLHKAIEEGFELSGYLKSDDDLESLHSDPRWAEIKTAARQARSNGEKAEERRVAARYDKLVARAPKDGESFYDMGRELLRADLYDQAAKSFQSSADRGYRVGTSLYNQACALSLGGKKDAALDMLQKSLDAGFDQPDIFDKDDDLDNVRNDPRFEKIVAEAEDLSLPSYGNNIFGRRSHSARAKWREAAKHYQTYADQHPEQGRAWYNLGFALLAADRADEATAPFQKALDLGYRKPETMYNLACTYARLDQKDKAFDWLFKALDAGFDQTWTMRYDEDLDNLRGDSRYRKAVDIARGRKDWSD
jgi:beta-lactamase regulating signal transducer with metallopeptidase domain/tetratricopeptide (TPR) repeat protein